MANYTSKIHGLFTGNFQSSSLFDRIARKSSDLEVANALLSLYAKPNTQSPGTPGLAFSPLSTTSARAAVWLDADDADSMAVDGDGEVVLWIDKANVSRSIRRAPEETRGPALIANAQNSRRAVRFDGVNDKLNFTHGWNANRVALAVFRAQSNASCYLFDSNAFYISLVWSSGSSNHRLACGGNGNYREFGGITTGTQHNIIGFANRSSGTEYSGYLNGTEQTLSFTDGTASFQRINNLVSIGNGAYAPLAPFPPDALSNPEPAQLELCELIIFDGDLSTQDRESVEGYLAHKWGLAGLLPTAHPYKSEAPGAAIYKGALLASQVNLGLRTEAQIYLGAKDLFA